MDSLSPLLENNSPPPTPTPNQLRTLEEEHQLDIGMVVGATKEHFDRVGLCPVVVVAREGLHGAGSVANRLS